jgi:hypothetical protein
MAVEAALSEINSVDSLMMEILDDRAALSSYCVLSGDWRLGGAHHENAGRPVAFTQ